MVFPSINLVSDARNGVGESPFWDAASNSLFWVDIPARRVHRWRPDGGIATWQADEMIGCIAPAASGGLVAGMESGIFKLQLGDDGSMSAQRLAQVAHADRPMRFNDGRCDRQGRFWAGTMHLDMGLARVAGAVYRLDARGLQQQLDGFIVPNGMAWSPDGRTLYLSDSHPTVQTIWAFDYDTTDGAISNRRLFVDMRQHPGRPDGAAVDADGCYWICGNDAGMVHRFTPQGRLDRSVPLPVKKPAMCAFGGPDMGTLFVTSIRPGDASVEAEQPLAGGVFSFDPGVKGLPEHPFAS
ncbi:Sugar lactone lactonase YvrE [Noviherbaspirillum humi]|uniref:Sugar lactone lactonase YvrE n=1 Tax=Noviherbaspirillum humi TaxID=1688639 RepID=A0A239C452_9BURK|nr:SMP-30/gluconolactonase/LRE family protein [Noviherbaspirillum humi]SNS14699.1 Sugar lactone lactonase YvrE [Noviherbaspirillum humi]